MRVEGLERTCKQGAGKDLNDGVVELERHLGQLLPGGLHVYHRSYLSIPRNDLSCIDKLTTGKAGGYYKKSRRGLEIFDRVVERETCSGAVKPSMCLFSMLENIESSEAFEGNGTLNTENLVWRLGVWGVGLRIEDLGLRVQGSGLRARGSGFGGKV